MNVPFFAVPRSAFQQVALSHNYQPLKQPSVNCLHSISDSAFHFVIASLTASLTERYSEVICTYLVQKETSSILSCCCYDTSRRSGVLISNTKHCIHTRTSPPM